ncbi:MAG: phosphate acetyltransferase [Rhodococcus sp. (in: high G+C Gram-positive bacteria)]
MSDLEYLATLFGRFDAEYDRMMAADAGSEEHDNALNAAADALYRLREKVKAGYPGKKAYYVAASTDPKGIRVEGIASLHGKRIHELVREQGWLSVDDNVVLDALDDDQIGRYRAIAGRGVAQTFRDARDYLWTETGLDKQ